MTFKRVLLAIAVLALSVFSTQASWASACSATVNPNCILGSVDYFAGGSWWDLKFNGLPADTLGGALSDNLGDGSGIYIDEDYRFGDVTPLKKGNWNITAVNARYLGNDPTALALTKFGSVIGINGYAELANLAEEMFKYGSKDDSYTTSGFTYAGWTFAAGTTYPEVAQILNEAIYSISTNGSISGMSAAATSIVAYLHAEFGAEGATATASAIAELKKDYDIWFLNGGTDKPEFMLQYKVPEGGSSMAFLLFGGLFCMGAVVYARRRPENNMSA